MVYIAPVFDFFSFDPSSVTSSNATVSFSCFPYIHIIEYYYNAIVFSTFPPVY